MPLTADVDKLARGLDTGLTHMYDEAEMEFKAPQIGSFFEVHREDDEHGVSLIGTARINKRNADVTDKIIEMYNAGRLKFSFEIWASELREEDGVTVVDAAPGNRLTAMAIVTTPALPAAVAIGLAAEVDINAFRDKVWRLLDRKFPMTRFDIIWMGLEYAVVYISDSGKMYHVGYRMDGNELVETEAYEVTFARVEEVDNMDNNLEAAVDTNVEEMKTEVEAVQETDAACDKEEKQAETIEVKAEVENAEAVEAEVTEEEQNVEAEDAAKTEELQRELDAVKAELAAYKEAEAKAQLAEKQSAARKYAEREGLNLEAESVKTAIENADYEALAAEVMAKPAENKNEESYRVVAEMKIESPYGNMFEKA